MRPGAVAVVIVVAVISAVVAQLIFLENADRVVWNIEFQRYVS